MIVLQIKKGLGENETCIALLSEAKVVLLILRYIPHCLEVRLVIVAGSATKTGISILRLAFRRECFVDEEINGWLD